MINRTLLGAADQNSQQIQDTASTLKNQEISLAEYAIEIAKLGHRVFPARPEDKSPYTDHGHIQATNNPRQIKRWWKLWPYALVAMPTGTINGYDVLDIDPRHGGDEWLKEYRKYLPDTWCNLSRSGGCHFFFKSHPTLRNSVQRIAKGVDVRSNGGYIVWWPSSGFPVLSNKPCAPWPEWLLTQALPPQRSLIQVEPIPQNAGSGYIAGALRGAAQKIATAQEGTRNHTLNSEAYSVFRFAVADQSLTNHIANTLARAGTAAGLSPSEIEKTLISAMRSRGIK